jgi:Fur family ferric uptake transcriptional regulator
MNSEEQFKARLRDGGVRLTTPRLGVFRILLRHAPMAMSALMMRGRADGIDPVTVYRTLELFRQLALVQEVGLGRNRLLELSDDYHAHHHHVMCLRCGQILDFDSAVIESELERLGESLGFKIDSHQLEATGLCAVCQAATQPKRMTARAADEPSRVV